MWIRPGLFLYIQMQGNDSGIKYSQITELFEAKLLKIEINVNQELYVVELSLPECNFQTDEMLL